MKEWKKIQNSHLLVFSFFLMAVSPQYLPAEWIEDTSQNLPICTAAEDQHFPDIISDNHGGVIVAWRDVRNGNRDVFAQRISVNGEMLWENDGIPICVQPNAQSWPLLVPDAGEGAILVFGDSRHRNRDIYAQRIDPDGKLLWGEDGIPVSVAPFLKEDVKTISDGKGGAIIVWEDSRHGNLDIYAQRIDGDGKPVWELDGVPVYKGEGDQYDPFLTTDDAGGAIIAWWDISTPDWNVYAQRMGATGGRIWEDEGVPVCTALPAIKEDRLSSLMVRAERTLFGQITATIRIFLVAQIFTPNGLTQMETHSGKRMVSISVMTRRISSRPRESAMVRVG